MPRKATATNGNGLHTPRKINFPSFLSNTWTSFTSGHITTINGADKTDVLEDEVADEKPVVTEQKIGAFLLLPTLALLLWKLYHTMKPHFEWRELIRTEWISESGQKLMSYRWETGVWGEKLIVPLLCGLAITIFTWLIVYLDSDVPGVNPPTPFSPSKESFYDRQQKTFHLGYIMSLASGFIVFSLVFITSYY